MRSPSSSVIRAALQRARFVGAGLLLATAPILTGNAAGTVDTVRSSANLSRNQSRITTRADSIAGNGLSRPQIRKYRANLATYFRLAGITEQPLLKRFNVGGAARWEDKADFDRSRPIYDKAHLYVVMTHTAHPEVGPYHMRIASIFSPSGGELKCLHEP